MIIESQSAEIYIWKIMNVNTIVIDDFLENPDLVRSSALNLDFYRFGDYPGQRTDSADLDYQEYIKNKLENILNSKILEFRQDSFCFQLCLENSETWIHHDETEWAGVLYLTPEAPVGSGTAIYRHVVSGIFQGPADVDVKDNNWEIITAIGNIYNRMILYKGNMFHRSLISGFGKDKSSGRLTQTFFFNLTK